MQSQPEKRQGGIEHPGFIEKMDDNRVFVRIEATSACGNCQSASYCGMAEVQEKIVEVSAPANKEFKIGMPVVVSLNTELGFRALMLGYLIPFLIMVAGVVVVFIISSNEPLSALAGVSLLLPYYALLYVSRKRLKKRFRFQIRTNNP